MPAYTTVVLPEMATVDQVLINDTIWFDFEKTFPHETVRIWFQNYKHFSLIIATAYICLTLTGQRLMENRKPYPVRWLLFAWNVLMAAFSAVLIIRMGPYFLRRVRHATPYGLVCDGRYEHISQFFFWGQLFVASKTAEFIDTLFVVLRKQKLLFIHWYHHATVVIACWYGLGSERGPANTILFSAVNCLVHFFMYSFYSLKTIRVYVPRSVNIFITSLQIIQMFIGMATNAGAAYYVFLRPDMPCDDEPLQIAVASTIYFSYLLLFCHFFYKAYFPVERQQKPAIVEANGHENGKIKLN